MDSRIILWIFATLSLSTASEYCTTEIFNASCENGEVILMQNATLGRMRTGRCILNPGFGYIGCSKNVLPLFHRWCSGRSQCSFIVGNEEMMETLKNEPCYGLIVYLEATYSCIRLANNLEKHDCTLSQHPLQPHESLYLSNAPGSKCGSTEKPWIVKTNRGQRIKLGVLVFGITDGDLNREGCKNIGRVSEPIQYINKEICAPKNTPESTIYTSLGHVLHTSISSQQSFVLKYEAFGCPDLVTSSGTWYTREGTAAEYGCKQNHRTWKLECVDNIWTGVIGNCSSEGFTDNENSEKDYPKDYQLPGSILIALIVGAALVVASGIFICFLLCIWKNKAQQHAKDRHVYIDNRNTTLQYRSANSTNIDRNQTTLNPSQTCDAYDGQISRKELAPCDCYNSGSEMSYEVCGGHKYHVLEKDIAMPIANQL